ncbi:MAG: ABC transporter permease [Microbacteriaceae bacterium]
MSSSAAQAPASAPRRRSRSAGGGLWRYLVVRFLLIIPTVFILVTMVFFLMRLTGDPITASQGGRLAADELARRIHAAGYDRPILLQYVEYLGQIARGDFGTALTDGTPIGQLLLEYGGATLELAVYAVFVAVVVGVPLGLLAGRLRDRWPDAVLRVLAILWYATPVFFVGLLLKLVFSVWLGVLPVAGRASTRTEIDMQSITNPTGIYLLDAIRLGSWTDVADLLEHAVLPALALGLLTAGVFLRLVRTNVIGTLSRDYIDAARSRGVTELRLVTRNAFKPALIPVITVMGLQIAMLLGGAILTETTFEWRGLGYQLGHYLGARDFVAVQGIVALLAVIVAVTNFIVDVIAALIDPRVRY